MDKREFLKRVAAIGVWVPPVVEAITLPAHAQMSPVEPESCVTNTSLVSTILSMSTVQKILDLVQEQICPSCQIEATYGNQGYSYTLNTGAPAPVVVLRNGVTLYFYYHVAVGETLVVQAGSEEIHQAVVFRCPGYEFPDIPS